MSTADARPWLSVLMPVNNAEGDVKRMLKERAQGHLMACDWNP
ncbi:hypothetical protein ACG02S_04895 [Roseateles sp. DC23W]|uniref:Glycosyl transferase family 2 n=1 Tax=Pelomonas dachongensis TaxID=3299029 RepID=A0ABW7EII5_9BURK